MKTNAPAVLSFILVTALSLLLSMPVQAQNPASRTQPEQHAETDGSLSAARDQLQQAFSSYREKDIDSTREHLLKARALLDQSALNSASQTVKKEVKTLVAEIESFEQKLAEGSDQKESSIARFWRRATSFIKREAEQLVHQYVELSQNEKTFKHLLDAKMHLFIAEHDLFISHDTGDAYLELDKVLIDLNLASNEALAEIKPEVDDLSQRITALQNMMQSRDQSWIGHQVISHLQNASEDLFKAEQTAMPETSLQIGIIRHQVEGLRKEVETINLRNEYNDIMDRLKMIISKLETE